VLGQKAARLSQGLTDDRDAQRRPGHHPKGGIRQGIDPLGMNNPDKGFSGCGFELIAGLQVELGLERVDLVGGDGRDDVDEGVDDGSMLGQIEG